MPRIKAYKGTGKIIPMDEARIVTAFRCPWTAHVFTSKKDYVAHLKRLRQDRMHGAIRRKIIQRLHEDMRSQPSFEDLIAWIERHPEFFFDIGSSHRGHGRQDRIAAHRDKFWIKITYLDLRWNESVSNTHSCPRGGVTNWGVRETFADGSPKPNGYPGWDGRIEYQVGPDLGFGSDVLRGTGINTGTGGGITGNRYGYGVKFFDSDWPGITSHITQRRVEAILTGNDTGWNRVKYGEPRYFR